MHREQSSALLSPETPTDPIARARTHLHNALRANSHVIVHLDAWASDDAVGSWNDARAVAHEIGLALAALTEARIAGEMAATGIPPASDEQIAAVVRAAGLAVAP